MDDVTKEKHGLFGFDLGDWPRFYPFGKLVNGDEQMGLAPGRLLEGPDQIKPRDHERPRDGDCLECLGWQMGLLRIVLTPFTSAHYVHGIGHHSQLVEALPKSIPDEGPQRGMVSAGTVIDVLQQLSPLLGWDTTLQDLGVALFIELSFDDDVRLSMAHKPLGHRLVNREYLSDETVKIQDPLVW
jgi:hypothetical protein